MSTSVALVAAWGVVLAIAALAVVHWMHGHKLDAHRDAVHGAARELHQLRLALVAPRDTPPPAPRLTSRAVAFASPDTKTDVLRRAELDDAIAKAGAASGRFEVGDRYGVPALSPGVDPCVAIDAGHPCMRTDPHDPPHLDVDSDGRITHVWTDSARNEVNA